MEFKKIYVEITNACNLNCAFCAHTTRKKEFITMDKFELLLSKLKGYTKYLYFHLMGEPMLHENINELIDKASKDFNVNITTNGYYINKIKENINVRQVNISLHSYDERKNVSLDDYLNNVFDSVDKLIDNNTIIVCRMWTNSKYEQDILNYINNRYNTNILGNTKIKDHLYFEYDKEFIWPDLNNNYYNENGSCQGLRSHVGILVDGRVVPCCLDYNGQLSMGNIYEEELSDILNREDCIMMREGFKNNKKVKELCKHCNFYDRIINSNSRK